MKNKIRENFQLKFLNNYSPELRKKKKAGSHSPAKKQNTKGLKVKQLFKIIIERIKIVVKTGYFKNIRHY